MQCIACGKQIADSAYACVYCGASVRERTSPRPSAFGALPASSHRPLPLDEGADPDATLVLAAAARTAHDDPDETLFAPADRTDPEQTPGMATLDKDLDEGLDEEDTESTTEPTGGDFPSARSSPPMRLIAAIVVVAMISVGGLWSLLSRLTSPAAPPAERVAMADPHAPQADAPPVAAPVAPPRSSASTEFVAPVSTDPLAGGSPAARGPEGSGRSDDPAGGAAVTGGSGTGLSARAAAARSDSATLGGASRRSRTPATPSLAAAAGTRESSEPRSSESASAEPRTPPAAAATSDKGSKTLDELLK